MKRRCLTSAHRATGLRRSLTVTALAALASIALLAGTPAAASGGGAAYGVTAGSSVTDANFDEALGRASRAGIGWIRVNCDWSHVMKRSEATGRWEYYWGGCDKVIDRVTAAGLQPMMFFFYSHAEYCTSAPSSVTSVAIRQRYPPCNRERGFPEFRDFVYRLVSRYGPRANGLGAGYGQDEISAWEVGNEPNHHGYFPAYSTDDPQAPRVYAEILDAAHTAAKAADPGATVVLGGLASGGPAGGYNGNFLADIVNDPENPAVGNFDVLAFHTYKQWDRAVLDLQTWRSQLGGWQKPIWVTEVSYASASEYQKQTPFWSDYPLGQLGQAGYLEDTLPSLLGAGADKVFWNSLLDSANDTGFYCSHGLAFTDGRMCSEAASSGPAPLRSKAALDSYAAVIAGEAAPPPAPTPPKCGGVRATIVGTLGDDEIVGTRGPDVIAGLQGNDTIRGLRGNDVICGNAGNDKLRGGAGSDRLFGGPGDDTLHGGPGADAIFGGVGMDLLRGGSGKDRLTQ